MRRRRALRLRTRLTLWYLGIFSLIFGALGLFLVSNLRSTLRANAVESLELTYRALFNGLADGSDLTSILHETVIPGETGAPEVIGQILARDGAVIESSGQPTVTRAVVSGDVLATVEATGHWHGSARLPGRDRDDVVVVVRFDGGARAGSYLVLAQTLRPMTAAVTRLVQLLLIAAPIALAIAGTGGWAVARAALRPVDDLTRRAASIDAAGADGRLPVPRTDDELARLAVTLNAMLDRLQRALTAERRFTADASHELRTPLAIMDAELDVALRSSRTPVEAKDVLRSVRAETSVLGAIVNNLLLLARAEASGRVALNPRPCDALEAAMTIGARFREVARAKGIALRVDGRPTSAYVDPDLLGQAVGNLVDNAVAHTGAGGEVVIGVAASGGEATITVTDTGEGIPAGELGRVFDRFYRVDAARDRRKGGSGLGLEITRRIVEAHGGRIDVASEVARGTTFTITLPAQPRERETRVEGALAPSTPGPGASPVSPS